MWFGTGLNGRKSNWWRRWWLRQALDVREEGGGGGGCREGEWGRRDWTEKEKGKEREGEVGYIFLLYVGPT